MKKLFAVQLLLVLFCLSAAAQNYSIRQYLSIRTAGSPTLSPDGRRLAYRRNLSLRLDDPNPVHKSGRILESR